MHPSAPVHTHAAMLNLFDLSSVKNGVELANTYLLSSTRALLLITHISSCCWVLELVVSVKRYRCSDTDSHNDIPDSDLLRHAGTNVGVANRIQDMTYLVFIVI